MTLREKSRLIKQWAHDLGFAACGITRVREIEEEREHLLQWLENNYHGTMSYMERNMDKRLNPAQLVPGARSIIVVLMDYLPAGSLSLNRYKISRYAWGKDYHYVIKQRLYQLLELMRGQWGQVHGRAFTDSAPVLERYWAQQAGLGWIGKNSLLLTKKGSYFFIGELIVDMELEYDQPWEMNFCGTCTRCLDACPTDAIVQPKVVDARRCLSYLTIEYRGDFSQETKLHGWVFGCDICQQVCPWNRHARPTQIKEFTPKPELLNLTDEQLEKLTKPEFKQIFRHTPVERTGYKGLMRNIKQNQKTAPNRTSKEH